LVDLGENLTSEKLKGKRKTYRGLIFTRGGGEGRAVKGPATMYRMWKIDEYLYGDSERGANPGVSTRAKEERRNQTRGKVGKGLGLRVRAMAS